MIPVRTANISLRRRKAVWIAWGIVAAVVFAQLLLTVAAHETGRATVEANPCATGWDNPWAIGVFAAFWIGVIGSVVSTVVAAFSRHRSGALVAIPAILLQLPIGAVCYLLSVGGYGWHC